MFKRYKNLLDIIKSLENRLTQAEHLLNYNANLSNEYEKGVQKSINTLLNKICELEKKIGEK